MFSTFLSSQLKKSINPSPWAHFFCDKMCKRESKFANKKKKGTVKSSGLRSTTHERSDFPSFWLRKILSNVDLHSSPHKSTQEKKSMVVNFEHRPFKKVRVYDVSLCGRRRRHRQTSQAFNAALRVFSMSSKSLVSTFTNCSSEICKSSLIFIMSW